MKEQVALRHLLLTYARRGFDVRQQRNVDPDGRVPIPTLIAQQLI
jgi:hypothetical protein